MDLATLFGNLDLTKLSWEQFGAIVLVVTAVDWLTGIIGALKPPNTFSTDQLLNIVLSHGPKVIAMVGLFLIGVIGAVPAICYAADALLLGYIIETFPSASSNLGLGAGPSAPAGSTP